MSDLVGNPEDRFSHNEAHILYTHGKKLGNTSFVTRVNFGLKFLLQSKYVLTNLFNLSKSVVSKVASA